MAGLYHLQGTRRGVGVLASLGKGPVTAGRRWLVAVCLTRWLSLRTLDIDEWDVECQSC